MAIHCMQIANRPIVLWLIALSVMISLSSCSSKVTGPQSQTQSVGGVDIKVSIRPGLPQDMGNAAETGDNTLIVQLSDSNSNKPIPDANVTAAPKTSLITSQADQSGRSQGNGLYYVPIRFGVPDNYAVNLNVQRPGQRYPLTAVFHFTVN